MAGQRFELPGIHELSKEQERARLLPKDGRHLIVGGPGTGKTVIALLRARRYHREQDKQDYVFLVFNRLLHAASQQLIGEQLSSATWKSWFGKLYWQRFGESTPKDVKNAWNIDWKSVQEKIAAVDDASPPAIPYLIIDEGQDMPPDFYLSLVDLGFEHFFVVADQNQQITEQCSSRQDLENALAKLKGEHASDIVLVIGHSNTVPDLIKAFGGRTVTMRDDEYDALYVLTPATGALTLIRY